MPRATSLPADTLFVGDSGRTDLTGGHRPTLAASIRRLMTLPDDTVVWPGHDYGPTSSSTIGWKSATTSMPRNTATTPETETIAAIPHSRSVTASCTFRHVTLDLFHGWF